MTSVIEMDVRCRKCANCLKARAAVWRMRAHAEMQASTRTWFATFTIRPQERYKILCETELRLLGRGVKWAHLSSDDQFAEKCAVIGKYFTDYVKRLRKGKRHCPDCAALGIECQDEEDWHHPPADFRYLLVFEKHKDGEPHMHALIHETSEDNPVRKRLLKHEWKVGFTKFNVVPDDNSVAYYVAKYLSKDASARVRASQGYGVNCEKQLTPQTLLEYVP